MNKSLAKSSFQVSIAQIVQYLCGYLIIVTLARGLGPVDYGTYGLVMSILLWFEFTSRLGIPQTMAKLIPENETDAGLYERTALGLTSVLSLFIFLLMIITAPYIAEFFNMPGKAYLFRLAAVDIPFYTIFCVNLEILGGRRFFGAASLKIIIYSATKAFGILSLFLIGFSVENALIINFIASIFGLVFIGSNISLKKFSPVRSYIEPIIKLALPMGAYSVGWFMISNIDLWCLKIISTNT